MGVSAGDSFQVALEKTRIDLTIQFKKMLQEQQRIMDRKLEKLREELSVVDARAR